MIGLVDAFRFAAVALVAAALASPLAYQLGRRDMRREASAAALERTVEILQSRDKTNAEISAADAGALCAYFGLRDDERAECVRRLATPDSGARNSGASRDGRPAVCQSGGGP